MGRFWDNWVVTVPHVNESDQSASKIYQSFVNSEYIFFLGGRLRTLRRLNLFLMAVVVLIVLVMVLYLIFEILWLWNNISPLVVIMFIYCWLQVVVNFIKLAMLDPGILPKNVHLTDDAQFVPSEYLNAISLPSSNLLKEVEVKYCRTCRIWRLPRLSHCSKCNCCVLYHDHHCPWLNNCVGYRNYWHFLHFLHFTCVTSVYLIVTCFIHIEQYDSNLSRLETLSHIPMTLFLLIYGFLLMIYPLAILAYHYFIISNRVTTREYIHVMDNYRFFNFFHLMWNNKFNSRKNVLNNWSSRVLVPRGVSTLRVKDRVTENDARVRDIPHGGAYIG